MGDDTEEFRELIERSSLGTPAARRLRARTPRSQGKLAARIADCQERLAECREAGDHSGAARALTELADAYLASGSHPAALDLARSATQEALAATAELQTAAAADAAAIRAAAKGEAAALRAGAEQERDKILDTARHQASAMRDQARREMEESEAQRIQAAAEFEFQLASRRQEAEGREAERFSAALAAAQKMVTEAEQRAAKANSQADKTRGEAERHARLLVSNARKNADLIITHTKAMADQLMSDVREVLERDRAATQRKLNELTTERERVSLHLAQLGQLLGVSIPAQDPGPAPLKQEHPLLALPGLSAPQKPLRPMALQRRRVTLAAEPASVGAARDQVKATIQAWEIPVDESDAVLLTSELVANAIRHEKGDTITLIITCVYGQLHVDVHDTSSDLPVPSDMGRGLSLVASLSSSWGYYQTHTGKAVYFTLALTSDSSSAAADLGSALPHGARRASDLQSG